MSARAAAIDIGTNTVLLLVVERRMVGGASTLVPVLERAEITRLGQGVDRTRTLAPEAVERTLAVLASYADDLRRLGVERCEAVGTSAMRDAAGGPELRARARAVLGFEPRVIAGDEEARLTFLGGLSGLERVAGHDEPHRHPLVFDIGGGSTEFILGAGRRNEPRIACATSLDVGSVRLTERHVRSDPPSADDRKALDLGIRDALDAGLNAAPWSGLAPDAIELVGVAGTLTTLAAIARKVEPYDGARVHGLRLGRDEIADVAARLESCSLEERCSMPGLSPKRADVIVAGARLCLAILDRFGAQTVTVSDRGVRWGLAEQACPESAR
jgi:exopolyphosphatase/guanosine-5'-triphosphate,3'-diphosphate pyrophosphatase